MRAWPALLLAALAGALVLVEPGGLRLAMAPLQAPLTGAFTDAAIRAGTLSRWRTLPGEVERLRRQVRRLEAERDRLSGLERENRRLRKLLKLQRERFPQGMAARVAARDPQAWYSEVILDRGREQGVGEDAVALTPEGLVGRVIQTGAGGSRLRLILDPRSAVPVVLARSGALGILYGEGGYTCVMKYLDPGAEVAAGDLVLTSGMGEIYPGGIPVGRVVRSYGRAEALFQSVQVRPLADFGTLRTVLLVTRDR